MVPEFARDAIHRLMVRYSPGEPMVRNLTRLVLSDEQKYRLAIALEDRFRAWAGESLIAFKVRRAALADTDQGARDA